MSPSIGINADSSTIDGNFAVLGGFLDEFERAGFTHAEIPIHGLDCLLEGRLQPDRLAAVKSALRGRKLAYTVHSPDNLNLADAEDPALHLRALMSTIDFAAEIGSSLVVYHGSTRSGPSGPACPAAGASAREAWADEIERLGRVADHARGRGVMVAVENIFRQARDEISYRRDPRELAAVVGAVDSPSLGICFDFGHAYISAAQEGFSLSEAFEAAIPRLAHVHIHDNFGKPCPNGLRSIDAMYLGAGDLHLPPGWGSIPYDALFPLFREGYGGVYTLELKPRFRDQYRAALEWVLGMAEPGARSRPAGATSQASPAGGANTASPAGGAAPARGEEDGR